MQIASSAFLADLSGNLLDTTAAAPSGTTITVTPPPALVGQLGILDLVNANGGINPATGSPWAAGDTYRLVFVTRATTQATSTDIATYNTFVQTAANTVSLGGVTWKAIGSTSSIDARDNINANPASDGTGEPVLLMNGTKVIADNYADLWDGIDNTILPNNDPTVDPGRSVYLDERGNELLTDRVFTGTQTNGTANDDGAVLGGSIVVGDEGSVSTGSTASGFPAEFWPSQRWLVDFNMTTIDFLPIYGISEPLTVQANGTNTFANYMQGFPAVGDQTSFTDDPDLDGITNGIEAWLGTNPAEANTALVVDGAEKSFSHSQNPTPPTDLTVIYEWSPNLVDWYGSDEGPVGGTTVTITPSTVNNITNATITTTMALPKVFIRLNASES